MIIIKYLKMDICLLYEEFLFKFVTELITMTIPLYDPCKDILLEAIDETEDRLKGKYQYTTIETYVSLSFSDTYTI